MNFLFPSFLWGLLAVTIPIAIHLFNLRKAKKIYFSNVEFLKSVEIQTSSFRRLKHLLVLTTRVLMLICLVIAFAQPFIPSQNESGFTVNGVTSLYLDNSFSMQNEKDNVRYLDVAVNRLNEVLGLLKNSGHIQLLTNRFSSEEQSFESSDRIMDRLTTIEVSPTSRTLNQVLRRQQKALGGASERSEKQLFWVSDFQKSTVGDLSEIRPDSTEKLFVVPVQAKTEKNLYVDSVWLNTPFLRELQNNILHVKVRNSGVNAVNNQVIKLYIGGTQISSASVNIEGNGSETASFNFSVKGQGVQKGQITFDDFPITFDNDYYFVLDASPKIKITHLVDNQVVNGFVGNVFGNDSIFQVTRVNVRNLDLGLLKEADLIVMEGVEKPLENIGSSLQNFVSDGGSVLIIPPTKPDLTQYNNWLNASGLQFSASDTKGTLLSLQVPDRRIPFFSDVFEVSVQSDKSVDMPSVLPIWRWSRVGIPLLFTKDDIPYLSRVTQGKGQLLVLGSPLQSDYGNFAQHALFVPVMYKIASMSIKGSQLAYTFNDQAIELEMDRGESSSQVFKLRKGEMEMIPVQRRSGSKLTIEIPGEEQLADGRVLQPGFYEVVSDAKVEHIIAVNYNKAESELNYYSPEDLREQWQGLANVHVFDTVEDTDFLRGFEKQHLGISLWKYFIIAALFFLLAEIVLIRFVK